jgi:hypothetical protein
MTFAEQQISFDSLIYQYMDGGGSPDRIGEWPTDDLEYLAKLVRVELEKRASGLNKAAP